MSKLDFTGDSQETKAGSSKGNTDYSEKSEGGKSKKPQMDFT